jgi:hypothetical protein
MDKATLNYLRTEQDTKKRRNSKRGASRIGLVSLLSWDRADSVLSRYTRGTSAQFLSDYV